MIQDDLKSDRIPKVILLCGKEQFLVTWAKKQIVDKYIEPASKVLDLTVMDDQDDKSATRIIESCETIPLLSSKKIVIVENSKLLSSAESKESQTSELGRLCKYLESLPESTMLIFISDSVDKKRKLPKAISKHGTIYDFDQLDKRELISFADKRFRQGKVSVPVKTMDYLIDHTGYFNKESDYDLFTFSNDIVKMIALAEDGVLTEKIIDETVESDLDTFIFSLMNSISENRKDVALRLLHNIVGNSGDVIRLASMIVNQFEIMYYIKELTENRIPNRMIVEKLGIKEYRLKVLMPFISKITKEKMKENLLLAYEIERNIKTGLLKPNLAMELFIARL